MPIYAVTVTGGKEEYVADLIEKIAKREKLAIYSIMAIPGLKGYIFVEAENSLDIQRAIYGLRYARKVIPQEISPEELIKYFEKKEEKIEVGNIVEILVGALKGARGKVIKVDEKKKEVTIELLDVPVPLTLTLPITNVRVLEKKDEKT